VPAGLDESNRSHEQSLQRGRSEHGKTSTNVEVKRVG
jgi:hypothetical protein